MLLTGRELAFVTICLTVAGAKAQYGPQIPIPSIGHKRKTTSDQKKDPNQRPSIETEGIVRSIDGKTLVLSSKDGRTFTMAVTDQTVFNHSGKTIASATIKTGATVQAEAVPDDQDNLTASRVELLKDPEPETQAAAANQNADAPETPEERTTILRSPVDAPNRPILHHGTARRRTGPADDSDSDVPASSTKTAVNKTPAEEEDGISVEPDPSSQAGAAKTKSGSTDLISRTRDWVGSFSSTLPNYVCQQSTTRYVQESKQTGWQAQDVVTAQVIYENGRENYRDITVGGKKTNKSMLEVGGSTSTGEFATTLRSLFSPGSRASFRMKQSTRLGQSEAAIYDFKVALNNSDWQIRVGGQTLRPAYSGSVWIDKNTAEVRRIEMEADDVPTDFPLDAVEWAVDYDKVMLSGASFFLPTHAENLGCQRGSSICMKNAIDFRNYHKYSGESTITFGQ